MTDALWMELRYSLRRLRRSPGLSLAVLATLALAIGANTTAFSLLNAVWLRTVNARDPDRLVAISATDTRTSQAGYIYFDTAAAFQKQQRSFSALSMYSAGLFRLQARGVTIDVAVEGVMPTYFDLVGAELAAGRVWTDTERHDVAGATPVVITERLWRRVFSGDSRTVGEVVEVDGRSVTIVGVTARGFSGLNLEGGADLFLPITLFNTLAGHPRPPARARYVIGRLGSGVTLKQARAEVLARWSGVQAATLPSLPAPVQTTVASQVVTIESLATGFSIMRREYGPSFVVVTCLTTLLAAIACVSLIGLMSARALTRRQELAVSLALGAGRARLFQGLLLDGVLLAIGGLAVALPIAWWSTDALTAMLAFARPIPFQRPMTPDARVLAVAIVVSIMMGLLIGLSPAWRAVHDHIAQAIRGGRAIALTQSRLGRVVLVTQVALSLILVLGAGLFAKMLWRLHANDDPFRARNVVFTRLARNPGDRAALGEAYFRGLLDQVSAIPGVESTALSSYFPAFLGFRGVLPTDRFESTGTSNSPSPTGLTEFISPGFFRLFSIAHIRGRDFTWNDDVRAPPVAIVNETLARTLFPGGDVIGRHLRVVSGTTSTDVAVVGVVADAPIGSIREPHLAVVFRPMMQALARAQLPLTHVRVNGDVGTVKDAYVRIVESNGHHFVRGVFTLDEWLDYALLQERLIVAAATSAGTVAVLLVCVGIFGALAHAVASRAREIGIRMALGASRGGIVTLIVRDAVQVVMSGVVIGVPSALAVAQLVRSQLYGVTPTDSATIISAIVVMLVTGIAAALVPALRASKVEPMQALHHE